MNTSIFLRASRVATLFVAVAGVAIGGSVAAAPPHVVTQVGTPVTGGVPGKPFDVKFQVKNTGKTMYSDVKVIFHVPEGLTDTKVAPANASFDNDLISWSNVPIAAGKSFWPAFTFTIDSGTKLGTKKNLWVEVQGTDMEATSTNFSFTARAGTPAKSVSLLAAADIKAMFESVYGRTPTASELKYWLSRRTDKPGKAALLGAMKYHQALQIKH